MGRFRAISGSALLVLLCLAAAAGEPLARFGVPTDIDPASVAGAATIPPGSPLLSAVQERLPPPRAVEAKSPAPDDKALPDRVPTLPELWGAVPISFMNALRLAESNNMDINQSRQVLNQARANLLRANAMLLPNFNIGSTYSAHEGNIAKTEGNIMKVDKNALFVGGGPSMAFSFTDAIYSRLVAKEVKNASRAGLRRVANDTYLAVANAYFDVLRSRRRLARVDETLDFLLSEKPAAARAQSKGLLRVVQSFLEAGGHEALRAELDRVRVEVLRRQEERRAALQDLRVTSAELSRLIRLDPEIPLWPIEDFRFPLSLPGDQWSERPLRELIDVAAANRPELAENRALVDAAFRRIQAARSRPFLPNVVVNYAWGDFGGSPNLISATATVPQHFGQSGSIHHFGTRDDLDFSLLWRLQNMGVGDWAAIREQQALHRQAQFRQLQVQDRVITDIVQAYELVKGWRDRVNITASSLFDADALPRGPVFSSVRLNFDRIRNVPGTRPLEVLDSIRGLNDLLDAYAQAVTEYERARFRLLIALGLPPQRTAEPPPEPLPGQVPPAPGP